MSPFPIFAILALIVLSLSVRLRFRTLLLLAIAIGLAADFLLDWLVASQAL